MPPTNSFVRRLVGFVCAGSLTVALLGCVSVPLTYPHARIGDVVDNYHGTNVPDPYRWLEDPDSPETTLKQAATTPTPVHDLQLVQTSSLWTASRSTGPVGQWPRRRCPPGGSRS